MKKLHDIKKSFNDYLKNGVKGFILGVIPVLVIELEAIIVKNYSVSFLYKIISDIILYGTLGIMISITYDFSSNYYPKTSKFIYYLVIVVYYLYASVILFLNIFFQIKGPLLS